MCEYEVRVSEFVWGGLTPQSVLTELGCKHMKILSNIWLIEQVCPKGDNGPGWVRLGLGGSGRS